MSNMAYFFKSNSILYLNTPLILLLLYLHFYISYYNGEGHDQLGRWLTEVCYNISLTGILISLVVFSVIRAKFLKRKRASIILEAIAILFFGLIAFLFPLIIPIF